MTPEAFETATQAMNAILLFRKHYSSSQEFQTRFQDILQTLRGAASGFPHNENIGAAKFLLGLADALDQANKPGKYVSSQ